MEVSLNAIKEYCFAAHTSWIHRLRIDNLQLVNTDSPSGHVDRICNHLTAAICSLRSLRKATWRQALLHFSVRQGHWERICYDCTSRCTSSLNSAILQSINLLLYWRLTVVSHGKTKPWRHLSPLSPPFYRPSYTQPLPKKLPLVTSGRWVWSVQDVLWSSLTLDRL